MNGDEELKGLIARLERALQADTAHPKPSLREAVARLEAAIIERGSVIAELRSELQALRTRLNSQP